MKKIFKTLKEKTAAVCCRASSVLRDRKGDLAVNTIGGIIIGVVVVGLAIVAINAFFPNFFTDMFTAMKTRLNANW